MSQPQMLSNNRQIAMLLQQALQHLTRNEFTPVEALLARARALQPDHADTLHLSGQMRWVQKRYAEAEDFYRKTIAKEPRRAEAHCHLGQVLHAMGRFDEAIAGFREALRLKLDLPEAHFGLGLALAAKNDFVAAERAYRAGLAQPRRSPHHVAVLKHNLGIVLSQQNRHEEALAEIAAAQAIVPNLPNSDFNRGYTLQMMGRVAEAEDAYRRALAQDPLDLKAHSDLNQLLYRMNRPDFLQSYDETARKFPDNAALYAEKGKFLYLGDRLEEAADALSRALALMTQSTSARHTLSLVLTRMGRFEEASREYESLLAADPDNAEIRCDFAECLLRADDPQKGVAILEGALEKAPHHQFILALWGLGLRRLEDPREGELNDYENFVAVFDLEPPQGFSDMASFNAALNDYLTRLHVDRREHINQTSRGGTKTPGTIFNAGHDLVDRLRERIDEAVAAYVARMKEAPQHPLLGRRAANFRYSGSWSTRLADCGFHINHVHPLGWISSAYYVAMPSVVDEDTQGWIKFGEPCFDAHFSEPVRGMVQPVPGRLVLFPSYMWHGTVPFHSQEIRTTVAFDVVPKP